VIRALLCSYVCLWLSLAACTRGSGTAGPLCTGELSPSTDPVANADTFVVLPDTQFYACAYPDIFESQTRWVAEQRAVQNIGIVVHTGDIVDQDVPSEWQVAASALHALDGVVPYLLTPGNHDINLARSTMLDRYFVLSDMASAGGAQLCAQRSGSLNNTYAIVRLRGQPWLFVGLEFAPRDASVEWASEIIRAHPDKPVVLFTHAYLYSDGRRYDRAIIPMQLFHPDTYGLPVSEGLSDGQDLWERIVEPNENVRLVLSGHVIPDGLSRASSQRASGSVVHEVLANYQNCDRCPCAEFQGGGGFLRIFRLVETGALQVTTYSPHQLRFLTDPENEFVLPGPGP
jgi:hypothetical protein